MAQIRSLALIYQHSTEHEFEGVEKTCLVVALSLCRKIGPTYSVLQSSGAPLKQVLSWNIYPVGVDSQLMIPRCN